MLIEDLHVVLKVAEFRSITAAAADLEDSLLWRPPSLRGVNLATREVST